MEQKFIDRDGLKVLWNQVNLKDYPNNETLMAVIDAIDETKADKETLKNYYLKTEADVLHTEIEDYVDNQVAALVNSAPETLDTLGELAQVFEENHDMIETLNEAIAFKANQSDLDKFKTETWTFTLNDGTTVIKQMVVK